MRLLAGSFLVVVAIPLLLQARLADQFDMTNLAFQGPIAIDIVEHAGGVFLITNEGTYYTFDNGSTWQHADVTEGIASNQLSAVFSLSGRIWVASNHTLEENSISDGLSYSDDNGNSWLVKSIQDGGGPLPHILGPDRTIFDITGCIDGPDGGSWMFFSAFAGGFAASNDSGATFHRLFPTQADSADFFRYVDSAETLSLRNRYFSCVVDTSRADTLTVWAGTAGGVFEYLFVDSNIQPDSILQHDHSSDGLTGDFIQSVGVQYLSSGQARTWVSNKLVEWPQSDGLSVGELLPVDASGSIVSPDSAHLIVGYDRFWKSVLADKFAWNWAFHGDTTFVATNWGLLYNTGFSFDDSLVVWDTVPLFAPSIETYAVEVVDQHLWVGTDSCVVILNLGDFSQRAVTCIDILSTDVAWQRNDRELPDRTHLTQNYPNPFNPSTTIEYYLPQRSHVELTVHNILGQKVATIVDQMQSHGPQTVIWNGENAHGDRLASGLYLYRLRAGKFTQSRTMILLK